MILLNLSSAESTILESGKQATWELRLPSRLFTSLSPPPTVDDQVVAFPVPGVSHVECHQYDPIEDFKNREVKHDAVHWMYIEIL